MWNLKTFSLGLAVLLYALHLSETISTVGCGTTKGCLLYPPGCNGSSCSYIATYTYKQDYVEFELFGKNAQWVAIGFSDDQFMVNTSSVVCYFSGSFVIRSAKILQRGPLTLEEASDLNVTYNSSAENSVQCRFNHPVRPASSSTLRSLDGEFYLIYAKGPVVEMNNMSVVSYHSNSGTYRGASADRVNLRENLISSPQLEPITTQNCGQTMGCLRYPNSCSEDSCSYIASFTHRKDYVEFELFAKDAGWVSIGFSNDQEMVDTSAVVCYKNNSNVFLRSSRLTAKSRPDLEEANDLLLTGSLSNSNSIQCRFNHPIQPTLGSKLSRLDGDMFLLYAKGPYSNNLGYHTSEDSYRGASAERVNVTTNTDARVATDEPDEGSVGSLTRDCGETKRCLRVPSGCNGSSCDYVATYSYQREADRVIFELFGKNNDWVAIGFSDDTRMPNTHSVFCYVRNGDVLIRSAMLEGYSEPTFNQAMDIIPLSNSTSGGIQCRFSYPIRPMRGSTLRRLDEDIYILWAKGPVGDTPDQHAESGRGVLAGRVNLARQLGAIPPETISTVGCGTSKGCLLYPAGCNGSSCTYIATYTYKQDYFEFELYGKDAQWVSIGFSDDQSMTNTDSVVCYFNGSFVIRSARIVERGPLTLREASDLNVTYNSSAGNSVQCRFNHPVRPDSSSTLRSLDGEFYLIYAKGPVKVSPERGIPVVYYHSKSGTYRGASADRVNLRRNLISLPQVEPIITENCGKTMGCLRYPNGCSGNSCSYIASFTHRGDHVEFEVFATDAGWVSIGFSDDQQMTNTIAVVCYKNNNNILIRSSNLTARSRPDLEDASDLILTGSLITDNSIQCRFNHPIQPMSGSKLGHLDRDMFLLYAKGPYSSNLDQHKSGDSYRGASAQHVNLASNTDARVAADDPDKGSVGSLIRDCGITKGCLRVPNDCGGSSCNYVATYLYQKGTNVVNFELFGKLDQWVAIGFSDDKKMPNTFSVFCYVHNGAVVIRSAKLVDRGPPNFNEAMDLTLLSSSTTNGIQCSFSHPLIPGNTSTLRRLDELVYLLWAKGSVSGQPNRHSRKFRGSSSNLVNVTRAFESQTTSPDGTSKKIHGSLMVIVWIFLASCGLFFARYTRNNWPDTKMLDTKVWFQFHRLLMVLVVVGTIASIIVIFVDINGFTKSKGNFEKHAILGLVVLVLSVLNPIGALLRPHPGASMRPYFNIFHRLFGVAAFVIAIATILLGLNIFEKKNAYHTIIGYAGFLGLTLIIMEISKLLYERKEEKGGTDALPGEMQMQTTIAKKESAHLSLSQIWLAVVTLVSLVISIVVIYLINK